MSALQSYAASIFPIYVPERVTGGAFDFIVLPLTGHELVLSCLSQRTSESLTVEHKPEALHSWVAELRARFSQAAIALALEQSRGAVIYALMNYDFLLLYPIPPKTLARYREAFAASGAKSDPSDAGLLLELVRTHRDRLRAWHPDDALTRQLRRFYHHHRRLSKQELEEFLTEIQQARPLTQDRALIEASALMTQTIAEQLRSVVAAVARLDQALETLFSQHPDQELFRGLPGAGEVLGPRLAARIATVIRAQNRSKSSRASPRSPSRAARRLGCIGGWLARSFLAKPFTNSRTLLARSRFGRRPTTSSGGSTALHITPQFALWLISGSGSSIAVGGPAPLTKKLFISTPWVDGALRFGSPSHPSELRKLKLEPCLKRS